MISFPLTDIEMLSDTCGITDLHAFYYDTQKGFVRQDAVKNDRGYYAKVQNDCAFSLRGKPWAGSMSLNAGWNLVPVPDGKAVISCTNHNQLAGPYYYDPDSKAMGKFQMSQLAVGDAFFIKTQDSSCTLGVAG
jgi:hypothetical protein